MYHKVSGSRIVKKEIMKALTCAAIVSIMIVLSACKKENSGNELTGKWQLTATLIDPGDGTGTWMPASQVVSTNYVKFDTNGALEGTAFPQYVTYKLKGSDTVTFTAKDNTLQNYRYVIKSDTMVMSPAGPIICYERCGIKFAKVK